jgi:hypothetical protein
MGMCFRTSMHILAAGSWTHSACNQGPTCEQGTRRLPLVPLPELPSVLHLTTRRGH